MNRPSNMKTYPEIDLKLGIKSSLPNPKATLALLILLGESNNLISQIEYSIQKNDGIVIEPQMGNQLFSYLEEELQANNITKDAFLDNINSNQMFKSQLESLIVAFELVWRLAKISFSDSSKSASAERTGGKRYTKRVFLSSNFDILDVLVSSDSSYKRILLSWLGFEVSIDNIKQTNLLRLLCYMSESSIYKLTDNSNDVVFNNQSIYSKALVDSSSLDITGDSEPKGALRILKSLLTDNLNPYLTYTSNSVSVSETGKDQLFNYEKRVDTFLALNSARLTKNEYNVESVQNKILKPIILYGVPGTGKTFEMQTKYCLPYKDKKDDLFITTFHQSFSYEEFVEGLKPTIKDGCSDVIYEVVKGVFYQACDRAAKLANYENGLEACLKDTEENRITKMNEALNNGKTVLLCIDEINRANVSAVFGDLISLIETSKRIGADNELIVKLPYSKKEFGVPANLMIIGTMNTADRSIQLIDSALRRRFDFIELKPNYDVISPDSANILRKINARIRCLLGKYYQIGHSFFIKKTTPLEYFKVVRDNIIPLLEEYFYNDVVKIKSVLNETSLDAFYVVDDEAKKAFESLMTTDDEEKEFYKLNENLDDDSVNTDDKANEFLNQIIAE